MRKITDTTKCLVGALRLGAQESISRNNLANSSYEKIEELTPNILRAFIDRIEVHEATGKRKDREQQIDIYYKVIGKASVL